jgi:hypothetical protein
VRSLDRRVKVFGKRPEHGVVGGQRLEGLLATDAKRSEEMERLRGRFRQGRRRHNQVCKPDTLEFPPINLGKEREDA